MKKCKTCGSVIQLSTEDLLNGYIQECLKTTNENSIKNQLCIECFHKKRTTNPEGDSLIRGKE